MRVRAYQERDLDALQRIHQAQGFSYPFPDLTNPLFMTKLVLLDDDSGREVAAEKEQSKGVAAASRRRFFIRTGAQSVEDTGKGNCAPQEETEGNIVGAALLRLTAEAYLLLDPRAGTPRQRWEWLLGLHATTEREAWHRGLEDVHAWLPPPIAAKFGKRLLQLGWLRDDAWTPYCHRLPGFLP